MVYNYFMTRLLIVILQGVKLGQTADGDCNLDTKQMEICDLLWRNREQVGATSV